ncbi:zona pellucida glycoprotein d [Heptranchias perlo]|uniref:zona pellucida glycoprotein d n=1 Tax=Heptranchias perlo TaxID=212740 RepID=UPI003559E396
MLYSSERNGVALAVVLADRFPLTINTVSTSLSLSWDFRGCFLKDPLCTLLLFDVDGINLHQEIVHDQNREITGLTPCEHYTVCLSIAGHHDVCAATITDPMPPSNLTAVTSSSNSVTVYWDKPALGSFDWFRLNVYLLGQKGESANPLLQSYSLIQSGTTFVIDGLSACQKVNISFATVCEAAEVKESAGIFVVTDTAPVKFVKVTQTAGSTDGYSVSWSVAGDPSEILFYIYKNGTLQLTQKRTEYVATGLRPCTQESLTLEAVCRAGAVADSRTITVATAPEMITNLAYKQTADGGFFSWHSPPLFHGIRISVENVLMAFTRKNYYQVCGLASCTRYQYMFEAVCGRWNSKAVTRAEFTGCPIEAPPSVHKRITVLPEKVHVRIYFPWKFADFMNDPTSRAYLKLASIASSKIVQLLLHPGKFSSVEVELLYMTKSNNTVEMNVAMDVPISSSSASLVHLLSYLNDSNVSARGSALFWNDEDECANITKNDCPEKSDCINTFDSYTCICHQGYFDISDAGKDRGRVCRDHGVFASCKMDFMKINVSKEFLADRVKAPLHLVLNDGSCEVKEEPRYYRFTITETKAYCGGQLLMNETHKIFKHVIINKYHSDSSIIREDPLILVVKCAYLRHSFAKMPLEVPPLVRTFKTIVQYSREKLHLTMSLYKDDTFSPDAAYGASPTIQLNDDLYLEVKSSVTDGTFGAAFVLEVASCWATTTPDSQGKKKFHFLQDSCPIDETFRWHSANGASSSSRFSLKMFHFTETAISPIYLHCQAKICSTGTADDCLTECPGAELPKRLERNVLATDSKPVTGIVSVGPINLWSTTKSVVMDSGNAATNWQHLKVLLWVIGGIIGTTLLIVFAVVVMKKIMIHNTQSKMARHLIQGKAVSSAL